MDELVLISNARARINIKQKDRSKSVRCARNENYNPKFIPFKESLLVESLQSKRINVKPYSKFLPATERLLIRNSNYPKLIPIAGRLLYNIQKKLNYIFKMFFRHRKLLGYLAQDIQKNNLVPKKNC